MMFVDETLFQQLPGIRMPHNTDGDVGWGIIADAVVLEVADRSITIDQPDGQIYRAIVDEPDTSYHFRTAFDTVWSELSASPRVIFERHKIIDELNRMRDCVTEA